MMPDTYWRVCVGYTLAPIRPNPISAADPPLYCPDISHNIVMLCQKTLSVNKTTDSNLCRDLLLCKKTRTVFRKQHY